MNRRALPSVALALLLTATGGASASAQTSNTAGEFWPRIAARYQWPSALSLLVYSEIKNAEAFPYQQLGVGAQLGYQAKAMARPHLVNIDPSKEHAVDLGAGYEYLHTIQSGTPTAENRLSAQVTGRHRPATRVLLEDRNLLEFRWIDGDYSTRYRNKLTVEGDLLVDTFRFTPYVSAEVFYSWAKDSWNEEQYAVGVEWPYKHLLLIDTYYLRQDCTTCDPGHLNVLGVALSLYFGSHK